MNKEQKIIKRIAKRDEDALHMLYENTSKSIFHYIFRLVNNKEMAVDLMIETYTQVWLSSKKFKGDSKVLTWILGIARNLAMNEIKKRDYSHGDLAENEFSLAVQLNSTCQTDRSIFEKIDQLKVESKIIFAQPNFIFQTFSEPMRKLQYAFDLMRIDKIHNFYKGRGIKVAIIDTGVDFEHKDLKDRVVFTKNFVKNDSYKKEIHGTAVAGIIGAKINDFGICGVAPESEIYALRACSQLGEKAEGRCTSLSIAQAMDEAVKKNVKVINMSFGSPNYDRLLSKLIDFAAKSAIFIVAPVSKMGNLITFPASHPEVISVGGIDEKGNPYPSKEISDKAKVLAPAENIFTTIPTDKHNFISGVSLSSAYVSGLLALYCEKGNSKKLPTFKGNLCRWEEELFRIPLCD